MLDKLRRHWRAQNRAPKNNQCTYPQPVRAQVEHPWIVPARKQFCKGLLRVDEMVAILSPMCKRKEQRRAALQPSKRAPDSYGRRKGLRPAAAGTEVSGSPQTPVGAEDSDIRRLFLAESAVIGAVGGALGLFFAWVLGRLVNAGANVYFQSQGFQPENLFVIPWWLIAASLVFSVLVSVGAGLYPAARAARIDPTRALRHD